MKLEKVTWTLTSLKRFGTNFLARANLVKSYALPAMTYLAAHVPLRTTESDFSDSLVKWFLFSDNLGFNPDISYRVKVSLKRLSHLKEKGGVNLPTLKEIFAFCKASVVFRALACKEEGKEPMDESLLVCYGLLFP